MKKIFAIVVVMALTEGAYSQNINWRSMNEDQRNIIQLNAGYDFGVTAQLGYGRTLSVLGRPVLLGLDYSLPMGSDLLDDFKVRLGGQVELVQIDGFSATLKIMSVFRRYENELVRVVSFGSDFGLVTGYYRPTWYAAGEFGFDKAITSHMKHSDLMRSYFPAIKDGWYIPTGGHYYYGIQGGKTIGDFDLSLRLGATNAQKHDEDAAIPYYLQLGLGMRI